MKTFIMDVKLLRWPILLGLLVIFTTKLQAQEADYWQQKVDTKIKVTLDDTANMLYGHIRMNYVNHSPDTLHFIYLHLYPNAFKNDQTAFDSQAVENGDTKFYFSTQQDKGYIDSLDFVVDGRSASLKILNHIDEAKLLLPNPLLPGDSVQIRSPFRVKLPIIFSRMGHDGQAYQISQWYPKPAVYDKTGWHEFPYLNQGEFYSEFGTYDVFITLPKNYILMGTGQMVNATHEKQWLDNLAALPLKSIIQRDSIPSAAETKTIHFHAEKVHDFAWFANKNWIVRKDTIHIPETKRIITAYRCFLPQDKAGWTSSLQALKSAIHGYSKSVGAYPYQTVKVVDGALMKNAGGMEYPTIAVIASNNNPDITNIDIVHEVGHNWFYGALASNERAYPWMDEGINSFFQQRYVKPGIKIKGLSLNYWAYKTWSSVHELQPADTNSTVYTNFNYFVDIYEKVPLYLKWLEAYMGPSNFEKALKKYYQTYKFKHPQPADFEKIFKQKSPVNIDWFFKAMSDKRPVDFALRTIKTKKSKTVIKIKNKSGLKGPVRVTLENLNQGGNNETRYYWTKPFIGKTKIVIPEALKAQDIYIDDIVPDFNSSNNAEHNPLAVRPFFGLNNDHRHKFWITPTIGYNYYDGFMVGLGFHDLTIPQNQFQFAFTPMYGTGSNTIVGTGILGYTWFFNQGWLHDLKLNLEGKSFDYQKSDLNIDHKVLAGYQKISPKLIFNIRKPYPRSPIHRQLTLKGYWIRERHLAFKMNPEDSLYQPEKGAAVTHLYAKVRYDYDNQRTFNPFGYAIEGQVGNEFAKISLSVHLRADYHLKNKGFYIRGYIGKLFDLTGNGITDRRYLLSTAYTGEHDYLYDHTFLARMENTGFLANQIALREGGFKVNTLQYANPIGLSDNWLAALNLKSDLPFGKIPVRIFGDLAALPKGANQSGMKILYEAGLSLHLGNFIAVYVPLIMSKDLNDYAKNILGKNRVLKTISFSINFNEIPWTKLSKWIIDMGT